MDVVWQLTGVGEGAEFSQPIHDEEVWPSQHEGAWSVLRAEGVVDTAQP